MVLNCQQNLAFRDQMQGWDWPGNEGKGKGCLLFLRYCIKLCVHCINFCGIIKKNKKKNIASICVYQDITLQSIRNQTTKAPNEYETLFNIRVPIYPYKSGKSGRSPFPYYVWRCLGEHLGTWVMGHTVRTCFGGSNVLWENPRLLIAPINQIPFTYTEIVCILAQFIGIRSPQLVIIIIYKMQLSLIYFLLNLPNNKTFKF